MLFTTHTQLNGRTSEADQRGAINVDSTKLSLAGDIKGEMTTAGQMLKDTLFKDPSGQSSQRQSQ